MKAELTTALLIGLAGIGALFWPRRAAAVTSRPNTTPTPSSSAPVSTATAWELPPAGLPYRVPIAAAERRHGIPAGLLGRLLYQESRFRPDIINGATRSSAGAVGIAQIVPRFHPGVDPLDPLASIDYAGKYLAENYLRFGDWELALAAYNWGPTSVTQALVRHGHDAWLANAPAETQAYVRDITRDVRLA